ncbi:hypothetical protein SFUMM280S_08971 [Streptomyces fumanus]
MRYRLTFVVGLAVGYVLGTRSGRERYEQLKKTARQVAQNPAVRNTAESAAQQGRQIADKAYHTVSDRQFGAPSLITRTTNDVQQVQMLALMTFTLMVSAPHRVRRRHRDGAAAWTCRCPGCWSRWCRCWGSA